MWDTEKKMVLRAAQRMEEKGLVVGTSGNISMRINASRNLKLMAITPSSCYYDELKPQDIVIVDFNGERIEGKLKPSVETMLHIEIYKARQEVNAIVHAHPVFGSVMAVAKQRIPSILDDQVTCLGGEIEVAEYAPSGSPEMVNNVVAALGTRNSVLIANHGTLSIGVTIREAITNCELMEKTAKVYAHAIAIGKITLLP